MSASGEGGLPRPFGADVVVTKTTNVRNAGIAHWEDCNKKYNTDTATEAIVWIVDRRVFWIGSLAS